MPTGDLWSGEGAPTEPQGLLWPLADEAPASQLLGVYDADHLVVLRHGAGGWTVHDRRPWDGLGLYAMAPGGRLVVGLTAEWDGQVDHNNVRVVDLAQDSVVYEVSLPELGRSPALAIDDRGALTGPRERASSATTPASSGRSRRWPVLWSQPAPSP